MASPASTDLNAQMRPAANAGSPSPAAIPQAFDFLDLKAQFAGIRDEVMSAVAKVMESQVFIMGSEVTAFEQEFAQAFHAKYAVACASGSDALVLALQAAGIGAGDEVITSPFTFVATAGSIARLGAKPVFVDIDPLTFNLDAERIPAAITSKTRAIMPVHLFGRAAELDRISAIAIEHDLIVVEDAAQAVGATFNNEFVGNSGHFGCFSFFPSKNLGGAGDGGMITTQDAVLADRLRLIRMHGSRKKYQHEILGTNSRLDALQAAILRVKLKNLDDWTTGRQAHAQRYRELFEQFGLTQMVTAPAGVPHGCRHVYNQFSIRCQNRDGLRDHLRNQGIPTEVYYPLPLHLQPAFSYLGYGEGQFPHSEAASREVLALPIFPELTEEQQLAVVQAIAKFYLL